MFSIYLTNRSYFHSRLSLILIALIIFTLPFSIFFNSILIFILFINWLIEGDFYLKLINIKKNILFYLPVGFYVFHIISYSYSLNTTDAAFDLERKLSFLAFPILIGTIKIKLSECIKLLNVHVLSWFIVSLICFIWNYDLYISFTNTDISNHGFRGLLIRPFEIHHVYMSMHIILAIFINIAYVTNYFNCNLNFKIINLICAIFFFFILVALSARTPLLAFIATASIIIFFIIFFNKNYYTGIAATLCLFILVAAMAFSPRLQYLYRLSQNTKIDYHNIEGYYWSGGLNLKIALWNSAIATIERNNLLFGAGIGDVQDEMQKTYKELGFNFAAQYNFNPHNQYLDSTIGLGLLGLFVLLLQFIIPLICAFSSRHYLYASFLIVFFICSFTECTLNRQKGIVFFCIFNSIFAFQMLNNIKRLPAQAGRFR